MAIGMTRWEPFRDLMTLRDEMDRMFGRALNEGSEVTAATWAPLLDAYETDDRFVVHMDLPGLTPDDIDVTLDRNLLTIKGERRFASEVREDSYHRIERRYGTFSRTISLPSHVDGEGIQASFRDGVLEVVVPKADEAKPRKIKVGEGARELRA